MLHSDAFPSSHAAADIRSARRLPRDPRCHSAFTLIELLVVIAILGLLVSIMLPGLQKARLHSQKVVCRTNLRQFGLAAIEYAQDNRDQTWPVHPNGLTSFPPTGGAWARLPAPGGKTKPGLLYDVVQLVDAVGECPMNRRTTSNKDTGKNMFGGNTPIDFDYTMVANTHGARLDRKTQMAYIHNPGKYPNWSLPPVAPEQDQKLILLSGLMIFAEENTRYWNEQTPDGLFSNADQFEQRHFGEANIAFLEGHVEAIKAPMGKNEKIQEPQDLDVNDIYVRVPEGNWVRMEKQSGTLRPYGWINSPKP